MNKGSEGAAQILHQGVWQLPYKATNVLCVDGVRRTCRTASEADTFFSLPASVQVKGKTITGFIMSKEIDGEPDLIFAAYQNRHNGVYLPECASGVHPFDAWHNAGLAAPEKTLEFRWCRACGLREARDEQGPRPDACRPPGPLPSWLRH